MVRVGIVGTAGIGMRHAEALAAVPGACVTALVDKDGFLAERLAKRCPGAVVSTSVKDVLSVVDAFHICTPPDSHAALSILALESGKHVFCEKPIAPTAKEAEMMVRAAKKSRKLLCMGFNMRFRPSYLRMKELIDSGAIGDPVTGWCLRLGMLQVEGSNWRMNPDHTVGMAVESLSHEFDTLRWLFGEVLSVQAFLAGTRANLPGFDDNAIVHLRMANGMLCSLIASWTSYVGRGSRGVVGTEGSMELFGDDTWEVSAFRWRRRIDDILHAEPFLEKLDHTAYIGIDERFVRAVETGIVDVPTGEDGLAVLRMSLAVKKSAGLGGTTVMV